MRHRVRVGTSGWEYRHWCGDFYPPDLPKSRWLEHYAAHFDTVELNNSFYRLPDADMFAAWAGRLPDGFAMAVKASRYLTHIKRLREPDEPLARLWTRARRLGDHLGPMLYQLPPRWKRNEERLRAFLEAAPYRSCQAIEIRDPDWYAPATERLLNRYGVALVLHDMPGTARGGDPVGPFVYVRFHGSGERYGGAYPPQRLTAWADRLAAWAREGRDGYVYFNNDVGGHAARDADRLRGMLAKRNVA
ncbi:MAG: DUF72 domain-containing protein [Candidatus Limnocylindria bacterium]